MRKLIGFAAAISLALSGGIAIAQEPVPEISGEVSYDCNEWFVDFEYIETAPGQSAIVTVEGPDISDFFVIGTDGINDSGVFASYSGDLPTDGFSITATLFVEGSEIGDVTEDVIATENSCPEPPIETEQSITIVKDANGAGNLEFDFDGDLGNFNLVNDGAMTFFVEPGVYEVSEIINEDWPLVAIDCSNGEFSDTDISDGDVEITLLAGDESTCVFRNEPAPVVSTATPTPTASATPVATATQQPQIIVVESPPVIVEQPPIVIEGGITPPNTGSAGILDSVEPKTWTIDFGFGSANPHYCWWMQYGSFVTRYCTRYPSWVTPYP